MTEEYNNLYENYENKSVIDDNSFSGAISPEKTNELFIPCNDINNFYSDTFLYAHLYNSLHLQLNKINIINNNDITNFNEIINNLKITIDYTTIGANDKYEQYTSNLKFKADKDVDTKTSAFNTAISSLTSGLTPVITQSNFDGLVTTGTTHKTTPDYNDASLLNAIMTAMSSITSSISDANKGLIVTAVIKKIEKNESVSDQSNKTTLHNIITTALSNKLINYTELVKTANEVTTIPTFKINMNVFKAKYNLTSYTNSSDPYSNIITEANKLNDKNIILTNLEPIVDTALDYNLIVSQDSNHNVTYNTISYPILYTTPTTPANMEYTKFSPFNISVNGENYDEQTRKDKFLRILKEILNKSPEEMMGYLLKEKLRYNKLLYNISLQIIIRNNYINSSTLSDANFESKDYFISTGGGNSIYTNINTAFENMKTNINNLKDNIFKKYDNNFLINKYTYSSKIKLLDDINTEYEKIQNSLNVSIKEYNKYITNFTAIKQYANYVIIFLIIIIIITILITILSNITVRFKNSYYITTFIILLIITYLFYNRFHHVNLYEKFTNLSCSNTINYKEFNANNIKNHSLLCNRLVTSINNYTNSVKELDNKIIANIYIADNKTHSANADNYLYKLYINKLKQNEVNRLKKVSLTNLIEGMKKQILYLFNIILLISCFIIIILFGLLLHSSFPFLLSYIIIICIILIIIMIIYFIFAIAQPTRLIANKNYWANNGPSENLLNKL